MNDFLELLLSFLIGRTLAFKNDALKFLKNWEVLIGVVDFSVTLLFAYQKANLFKTLELALNVAGIFFDQLGKPTDMRFKVGVFSINHDNLAPYTRCNKGI